MTSAEARTYDTSGPTASQIARAKKLNPEEARKLLAQQEATADALRKAAELKSILANLEKVDDESRRGSLLDTLCPADDVLNLPEHSSPPGIAAGDLLVDLLRHQVPKPDNKQVDNKVTFFFSETRPAMVYHARIS